MSSPQHGLTRFHPFDLLAAACCAAALAQGIRVTGDLQWPVNGDIIRDIAQAQVAADGAWGADPFYLGELAWYPPLVPGLVAGLSVTAGRPVPRMYARAGAWLNMLAPLAFYAALVAAFDRRVALAALVGFLFINGPPVWASATYTPWLIASSFAQGPFFAGLALYFSWWRVGGRWRLALAGALAGVTFLAHSAPAILLASIACLGGLARAWSATRAGERREALVGVVLVAAASLAVVAPVLAPVAWRYRFTVLNYAPFLWIDPALSRAQSGAFLREVLSPTPWHLAVAGGLVVALSRRATRGFAPLWSWIGAALALFAFTAWGRTGLGLTFVDRLPFPPSHHFLRYLGAAAAVLFGCLVAGVGDLLGHLASLRWPGERGEGAARLARLWFPALVLVAVVAARWPAWIAREDFTTERDRARAVFTPPEYVRVLKWLRHSTAPDDVFLTIESAAESIVGPSGRKVVSVGRIFSSPYVDWRRRRVAEGRMWEALEAGRCGDWSAEAAAWQVRYVMTVAGRTADIRAGRCGLEATAIEGEVLRVLRVPAAARRSDGS